MAQIDQSSEPEVLDLDRYVPALLTFLSNKLSSGASACYRKHFGVGVVEWRVLALLAVENGITANRICQVIGLDKSAVSRALRLLEDAGHVKTEADPADARRVIVHLTSQGRTLHNRILRVARAREQRLLDDFTADEVDTLVDLLQRMNSRVQLVNSYDPSKS
ncbi:MarR family winged helix-turn-helix transcriptional regulator [Marinobacterium rhizophilum]|uniref:MarR family transcriptional regulator n=1 Tax=Marinobacterium rhizophilum TaxID=420402 RepID=A0ABY5HJU8_9GAMM|nr:MarR family transcriptional regulator [Marinobacterium rhizophilum]UTW12224.1 MarR family transcriptional regulator [Marinobacterium rhizophilum]